MTAAADLAVDLYSNLLLESTQLLVFVADDIASVARVDTDLGNVDQVACRQHLAHDLSLVLRHHHRLDAAVALVAGPVLAALADEGVEALRLLRLHELHHLRHFVLRQLLLQVLHVVLDLLHECVGGKFLGLLLSLLKIL